MKFMTFFLLVLTLGISTAQARKPAVEDFIGVEPEGYLETPKGTEIQFNFDNPAIESVKNESSSTPAWFSAFAALAFATLPFMMWYGLTRKQNHSTPLETPNLDNLSEKIENNDFDNVESLANYKDKKEDKIKKAS